MWRFMCPITTIPNSKVLHFCKKIENIYVVSNVKKLVWGSLMLLFFTILCSMSGYGTCNFIHCGTDLQWIATVHSPTYKSPSKVESWCGRCIHWLREPSFGPRINGELPNGSTHGNIHGDLIQTVVTIKLITLSEGGLITLMLSRHWACCRRTSRITKSMSNWGPISFLAGYWWVLTMQNPSHWLQLVNIKLHNSLTQGEPLRT